MTYLSHYTQHPTSSYRLVVVDEVDADAVNVTVVRWINRKVWGVTLIRQQN